jgi:hypothetical protein
MDEGDLLQGSTGGRGIAGNLRNERCQEDAEASRSAENGKGANSDLYSVASGDARTLEGDGRRLADPHGKGAGQSAMRQAGLTTAMQQTTLVVTPLAGRNRRANCALFAASRSLGRSQ